MPVMNTGPIVSLTTHNMHFYACNTNLFAMSRAHPLPFPVTCMSMVQVSMAATYCDLNCFTYCASLCNIH